MTNRRFPRSSQSSFSLSVTMMDARLQLAPAPDEQSDEQSLALIDTIVVVIADDHPLMRQSLRAVLDQEDDIEVAAEADHVALAERHVHGHRPDVLVLDLTMPNGLDSITELRERTPSTRIVVVSMDDAPGFAQRTIVAGASGYVLKDLADEDLAPAVRAAARGEEFLSAPVASRIAALRQALAQGDLTLRETEVLRLIALGHTSVEIAHQLQLSPRTIETHRARIHRKLEVRTRAELVGYALRCGLLST